jgi:hypothetical protein
MKTKIDIYQEYKFNKIIESKKKVLKIDIFICVSVLVGILIVTI